MWLKCSLNVSKNIILGLNTKIIELELKTYKYFGINETKGINHIINKDEIRKEF